MLEENTTSVMVNVSLPTFSIQIYRDCDPLIATLPKSNVLLFSFALGPRISTVPAVAATVSELPSVPVSVAFEGTKLMVPGLFPSSSLNEQTSPSLPLIAAMETE